MGSIIPEVRLLNRRLLLFALGWVTQEVTPDLLFLMF